MPSKKNKKVATAVPQKTLMIEILIKECTPPTGSDSKVSELSLYPTEKDLWAWDPTDGQLEVQATFNDVKEMQLFELDRLLKKEARDAELVIGEEIENIEP